MKNEKEPEIKKETISEEKIEKDETNPLSEATDEYDRIHEEMNKAIDEETRIFEEIDKVSETTPDQNEAEKIILDKWAPLMDKAKKELKRLIAEFSEANNKVHEELRKEYGIEE